jgi:hypothetical protein
MTARYALIRGVFYAAGGVDNIAPLVAALSAAGVQSAPLFNCRGRWIGYEIYYYPPGPKWGPGGYLDTREGRDWLPGEAEKGIR